ncbi:MAG: ACP S-malonyltransferase, partial [Candidatus Margulisiibacteriota bacterium]
SQFIGMGKDFYDQSKSANALFESANDILGYSISDIAFNGPEETLNLTQHTQVAIFILSACIFNELKNTQNNISQFAGHSLGEITAYYAAGVLDFESALRIVIKRGQLMGEAASQTKGKMAAIIGLSEKEVKAAISDVDGCAIANYNSPVQFVISGEAAAIDQANELLKGQGAKRVIELPVSGAFHSPLMGSAVAPFKTYLDQFQFNNASHPIVLNRTAMPEQNADALRENLSLQIQSPVRWIETIEFLSDNAASFIEVGPGKVLSGLIKKTNRELSVQSTSTHEAVDALLNVEV